ncbi:MAG: tripartite tricarboxylate transporter TctB family protein [Lachnospiraceae bacterium]|nr:tripartite tricarboxylate transporter TctB family protein [Lachnospiraceae bacterium]
MKLKAKTGDLILAAMSVIVGIVILILVKVQNLALIKRNMMGPGFFPTICGAAIIFCGILLFLEIAAQSRKAKTDETVKAEQETKILNPRELKNLLLFLFLGAFVLIVSDYLGLLICLFICVVAYLIIQGKEKWWKALIIGVGMTVVLYLIFVVFLKVPLPKGPLGF